MVIHSDEQLPIKEGSAELKYYYEIVSIILSAEPDQGSDDCRRLNQKSPWWKWFGCVKFEIMV
jgi:hypothetical protein